MTTKLLIDAGNTNIKGILASKEGFKNDFCLAHDTLNLEAIKALSTEQDVESVVVSSVLSSEGTKRLVKQIKKIHQRPTIVVSTMMGLDMLTHTYKNPNKLGVDRWMALIGARSESSDRGFAVLDFGTAVTLDLVDEAGRHIGGHIIPNTNSMKKALLGSTQDIRYTGIAASEYKQSYSFGDNTESCVDLGIQALLRAYVEQMIKVVKGHIDEAKIYACGNGISKQLLQEIDRDIVYDQHLMYKGMLKCADG